MYNINVNNNLVKERLNRNFNVEELTNVLDGGKVQTKRRKYIENLVYNDGEMTIPDVRHMTEEDKFIDLLRRHIKVIKKYQQHELVNDFDLNHFRRLALNSQLTGLTFHEMMFLPMLKKYASQEQLNNWSTDLTSFQMIGCYAHMELGCNDMNFETTAIYNPKSEEYLLNTPTLLSTKWRVGGLGKVANHVLLVGGLQSNGECCGLQLFLVKIRDHNHNLMPGVVIGDVGVKMGLGGVDEGYLRLTNVRIPRLNMMMKYSKILKDGTFVKYSINKKLFEDILKIGMDLCDNAILVLCMSITIAIRYSCVRQQSNLTSNQDELPVINYQTQQNKLFPIMCKAFAFKLSFPILKRWIEHVLSNENHPEINEVRALLCGLKVIIMRECPSDVELCRMACGGHGYSVSSNLPILYKDLVAGVTVNGEHNLMPIVLLAQMARFLINAFDSFENGQKVGRLFPSLMQHARHFRGCQSLETLLEALGVLSIRSIKKCREYFKRLSKENILSDERWNGCLDIINAALGYTKYAVARTFVEKVKECQQSSIGEVLENICKLYLVEELVKNCGGLLQDKFFNKGDVDELREELLRLYDVIRPNAVSLVDAFDFNDKLLNSALGSYNGNVYADLFDWAQKSQLNKNEVHPSFGKYLKSMRNMKRSNL